MALSFLNGLSRKRGSDDGGGSGDRTTKAAFERRGDFGLSRFVLLTRPIYEKKNFHELLAELCHP